MTDRDQLVAAVKEISRDPRRFQQLTEEDKREYGEPAIFVLNPPPSDDPASERKRRNWIAWRGAPYPAERHAEYVFNCADLADDNHPRILLSAVLDIHAGLDTYIAQFDKKKRYAVTGRKAYNAGFTTGEISPAKYAEDIWQIIHSSAERQGRAIAETFDERPRDHSFPDYETFRDAEYKDICVGAFAPDGQLVAYILGKRVGDHVQYDEIMGHRAYLAQDVVGLAHYAFLQRVLEQEQVPRCLNYGPWYSGANAFSAEGGLNFWKRKNRFRPAYLINASC